ncbi:ABC transporter ATP-binding protein [Spirosoma rhododendri]|uniref:ATP-binding cassette domain-containing protein n=1 Tax=Spirosoma rhododendri TaxID=2728024 RepID=A0A7L5DT37_9BACT|nr:ATP-binding cassette domain-containing protein [Spirosoma rhododendri]QJD80443.1 ATP-binding cassette domain-containing protein [Spirosoma rhododendri]
MLTVTNLLKAYDGTPVLTVPNLTIPPGIHYFRGSNGSGKTTFLRIVAGLLPFSGQIILEQAYDIRQQPVDYRLRVNYAEAEPLYPDFLTARDLATFVANAKRAPAGQVDQLADLLGVTAFWTQPTRTFSSGMLKKLSLLLAWLGQPTLVLLDEPLTTLDVETAGRLFDFTRERVNQGVSVWLTSHQDITLTGLPLTASWQVSAGTIQPIPDDTAV